MIRWVSKPLEIGRFGRLTVKILELATLQLQILCVCVFVCACVYVCIYKYVYGFSSSHVWSWKLDHKEGWMLENWHFWIVVLKTLESPLSSKEIKPVNPKGNQPWNIFWKDWCWSWSSNIWPPDAKSWLTGKDPDAEKDWEQKEKGVTEDEMAGWHHRLSAHEFKQTPGDSEEQGSVAYFSVHGITKSRIWLSNWTTTIYYFILIHCFSTQVLW